MSARGHDRETRRNEAFTEIFDAHWAAVRHHAEGVVEDDAEVAEIVSEVFMKAWARLDPAKPVGRLWLLRATQRVIRSRSCRPVFRRSTIDTLHRAVSRDEDPPDLTTRARVVQALDALTAGQRRIIMLTYWDGLAVGEIAEVLRIPPHRVRKSQHRAQIALLATLDLKEVE